MSTPTETADEIEQIIDATSVAQLLELIAGICHEKAEHLRSNWQDNTSARCWERDAAKLLALAIKLEN